MNSVDSVNSGRISQTQDIITSLSPLISNKFLATFGLLTLGIAVIGGITILRAATN